MRAPRAARAAWPEQPAPRLHWSPDLYDPDPKPNANQVSTWAGCSRAHRLSRGVTAAAGWRRCVSQASWVCSWPPRRLDTWVVLTSTRTPRTRCSLAPRRRDDPRQAAHGASLDARRRGPCRLRVAGD
eukprot:scaffold117306_cov68-Phaeocystis_antarctica.AAC.2